MTKPAGVVLDLGALQVDGVPDRGIGRYVAAYASALARTGRLDSALLVPESAPPSNLTDELIRGDLLRWDSASEMRRLLGLGRPFVYHVAAPFLHMSRRDPPSLGVAEHWATSGVPRVVIVYDLIPLRAPHRYLTEVGALDRYRARADWVGRSDLLLAISEHTRGEIIDVLGCDPQRIAVVGAGVASFFSPADGTDEGLWRYHAAPLRGRPYILTVGGSDWRKNTEALIAALGLMRGHGSDLGLVVVGDLVDPWKQSILDAAAEAGVSERLLLAGAVGDDALRALYRRAVVSVMPSLSEGYGLPVLESAACGTPALASETTSLAEVAATPLATFDPTSPESIAVTIGGALEDDGRRTAILEAQSDLVSRSTWDHVAARAIAAIDRIELPVRAGTGAQPAAASTPFRLALVGPFPPYGGGIGTFDRRLVDSMPPEISTDVVVLGEGVDVPASVPRVHPDSFGFDVRPSSYDGVVYILGNSSGHLHTVELALRYPGWLWLHESRLPAIATTALAGLDEEAFTSEMAALLRRSYPGRAPLGAARRAGRSVVDLTRAGVGLLAPLADSCRGILVNSEVARRLVLLDLRPMAHHPPVLVLPPACPPVRASGAHEPREITDLSDSEVVAFGVVSMSKRPDLLVDAVAEAGCRLTFVGPCEGILAQFVQERAAALGVADRVVMAGKVDQVDWEGWMARADLAVQLRDSVTGETSAAVLEALSSGLPVLTNIATAREWPDGVVAFCPPPDHSAIGQAISSLLLDAPRRSSLSSAGKAFAADHQFGRLSRKLLEIVLQP